jgi:hypothetical protein
VKKRFFWLLSLLILAACARDKIDFDMLDDLAFNPQIQVPLVNARLSLADIVAGDTTIQVAADNSLSIVYVEDSLFEFAAVDFVNIPRQEPTTITLVENGLPFIALNVGLGTLGGVQLSSANFDGGYLVYTLRTATGVSNDVDVRLRLTNATLGGNTFDQVLTLPQGTTVYNDSIDISGLDFDFSNGGTTYNYLEVYVGLEDTAQTPNNQSFDIDVAFAGLAIQTAEGFFGNRVINIPNGQFDLNLEGLEEFTSGFRLTNPTIKLKASSNIGMDIGLAPKFNGVNADNKVQALGFTPQTVSGAPAVGQTVNSEVVVDRNNSDIVDFLANLPNKILYSGSVNLNPGQNNASNFITKDARLRMGLELDIPLEFSAQNMTLEQKIEDVNILDSATQDLVEEVTLYFRNKNGFPFELDLTVVFLDRETGDSINGVYIPLLEPAPIDMQGRVTQKLTRNFSVKFEQDQIVDLAKTGSIIIKARLNTPNGGNDAIKLYSDYDFQTLISVRTKVNYELKTED